MGFFRASNAWDLLGQRDDVMTRVSSEFFGVQFLFAWNMVLQRNGVN